MSRPTIVQAQFAPMNEIAEECRAIALAHGWKCLSPESWDDENIIPAKLALIHSEVSEALEGFRRNDRDNVGEELADVIIRTFGTMIGLGYDIDTLVRTKMAKNRLRSYKHGGKRI